MFSFPSPTNSRLLLVGWLDDRKFVYCVLFFFFPHFIISRFPLSIRSHSSIPPVRLISLSHVPPPLLLYYHKNISVCLCNLFFLSFSFFIFCVPFFSHFFCCYFVITSTDQEKKNVTTESKRQTESLLFLRTKPRR